MPVECRWTLHTSLCRDAGPVLMPFGQVVEPLQSSHVGKHSEHPPWPRPIDALASLLVDSTRPVCKSHTILAV